MIKKIRINTNKKQEIIDITEIVRKIVRDSEIQEGICIIYIPHSTAGIIINESNDKEVCYDILNKLEEIIPQIANYKHNCINKNAHAHIKASIISQSEIVIIKNSGLLLGTWQKIGFAEFDGPRERTIIVKIIEG
jgi:secondary thiamine-phosphate synthase enzyme